SKEVTNALILTTSDIVAPTSPSVRSMLSNVARASAPMPPATTLPSAPKPTLPATWIRRPGPTAVTASEKPEAGFVTWRSMLIVGCPFGEKLLQTDHAICDYRQRRRPVQAGFAVGSA